MTILEFPPPEIQTQTAVSRLQERPSFAVPPDAAERAQALETDRSWIVEAPAGSGKTGLLIQRYLKLLTIVDRPESVLALTFTNKATAEMRNRVLDALHRAERDADPGWAPFDRLTWQIARDVLRHDAARGWNLRAEVHRLNICTIDSLCGEIARAVPVLAGGIGSATPVAEAGDLYREAARTVLLQFGGIDTPLNEAIETMLLQRDGDLLDCEKLLAEMLGTREQWGDLLPLSRALLEEVSLETEVLPRLNQALESVVCSALSAVSERFPPHLLSDLTNFGRRLAGADGYRDEPNPLLGCAHWKSAPGSASNDLLHWRALSSLLLTKEGTLRKQFHVNQVGVKLTKAQKSELGSLVEELRGYGEELPELICTLRDVPEMPYPEQQWRVAKALFRLLSHALIELRLLFAEREVCDFTELSMTARTALREEDGTNRVAAALGMQLEHLLVDEMQDTSTSQYELLEALTAGWNGRDQTVLFVGDPKQSIYLFRQARVERFLEAMRSGRLGGLDLGVLRLSANFRSGATLVQSFNDVFRAIFPPGAGEIGYSAAAPMRAQAAGEALNWHIETWSPTQDAARNTSQRRRLDREEAEAIAKAAYEWQRMPLPVGRETSWKIAVLARSRAHVFQVTRKLKEAGVPFRAVEIEHLEERPEVLDLLALTRALLHPADRVAWLAVLRAPWCGMSLNELHTLSAGDSPALKDAPLRLLFRENADRLPADARQRLLRTLEVLDTAIHERGRTTVAVAVERVWTSLGGGLCTDELARTNVRRYLELLEEMGARGELLDAASVRKRIRKLYAEPAVTPGAVDVMTIHKAKGLEWDLVLLPGLHKLSARDDGRLLDWMELPGRDRQGHAQVLLAPVQARGDEPGSLNRFIRTSRLQHSRAELKRLFYVAVTRARTSVQLFASPALTAAGEVEQRRDTLLFAAWPAAEQAFRDAEPPSAAVLHMPPYQPGPSGRQGNEQGLALAAAGTSATSPAELPESMSTKAPRLQRLPLAIDARAYLHARSSSSPHIALAPVQPGFLRPEGPLGARAFGNAVHAFLDHLARSMASTPTADSQVLLDQVEAWSPRIRAVLRSEGLPAVEIERFTAETLRALRQTLLDTNGRWLLQAHPGAVNEAEFGGWDGAAGDHRRYRLDRSFWAGAAPGLSGSDVLWILDYKTTDRRDSSDEAFLIREREKYEKQLQQYAELRAAQVPEGTRMMLALYFPMLPALSWWEYLPPG